MAEAEARMRTRSFRSILTSERQTQDQEAFDSIRNVQGHRRTRTRPPPEQHEDGNEQDFPPLPPDQQAPVSTPTRIRPAPRQDGVENRDLSRVQQAPVPTPTRTRPAPRQNGVENRDLPRGHVAPVPRGRTLTIRRETIAEQMEDIKLRIQGKMPDPPRGQVKSVQDWPLTLRWMENIHVYT